MFPNRRALANPVYWLAALIGTVLLMTMVLLRKASLPDFAPLAWLIPLAVYDLRKREVPHIAFVAVPCGLAVLTVFLRGDWTLGALTLLVVAASERHHLPKPFGAIAFGVALIGCVALLFFTPFEQTPGAIAIIGFWLAYELGWWAGADALAAMTLAAMWPDVRLLVSLAAAHMVTAIFLHKGRVVTFPRRLAADELERIGVAGMPAIALGAAMFSLWQWWSA
jgi:hypothetical protein